jgi:hypothetical protein
MADGGTQQHETTGPVRPALSRIEIVANERSGGVGPGAAAEAEALVREFGFDAHARVLDPDALIDGLKGASVIVAAGAAGAVLLPESVRAGLSGVKVLIDLNALPPLGIEGVETTDKKAERGGALAWGALGVGGTKMKIHKAALKALFEANDKVIDAEEALAIGRSL